MSDASSSPPPWSGLLLTCPASAESYRSVLITSHSHVRAIWAHGFYGCSTRSTRFKPAFMEKKRKRFVNDDDDIMPETMQLSLIEAFYLAEHSLLLVTLGAAVLSLDACRSEFSRRYSTDTLGFDTRYHAYKTFREAGWIPKTGTQYGSNYVLYATDPDHCHSKFCVTLRGQQSSPLAVVDLMRQMRVAEQTRKRAVLCDSEANCVQFRRWVLKQPDVAGKAGKPKAPSSQP